MEIVFTLNNHLLKRCTATVDDFDRLMAINARSTFLCYKHAAKQMIAQGRGGRIIGTNISYPFNFLLGTR